MAARIGKFLSSISGSVSSVFKASTGAAGSAARAGDAARAATRAGEAAGSATRVGGTVEIVEDLGTSTRILSSADDVFDAAKIPLQQSDVIASSNKFTQEAGSQVKQINGVSQGFKTTLLSAPDAIGSSVKALSSKLDELAALRNAGKTTEAAKLASEIGELQKTVQKNVDGLKDLVSKLPAEEVSDITRASKGVGTGATTATGAVAWLKRNKLFTAITVSAVTGIIIAAEMRRQELNSTVYTITSIVKTSTSLVTISYSPPSKFSKKDTVVISGSNSEPKIDRTFPVINPQAGTFQVAAKITKPGDTGTFKCQTSFGNQFSSTFSDVLEVPTDIAVGVAEVGGDVVGEGLGAAGRVTGKVAENLPIVGDLLGIFKNFWWVILIFIIFSMSSGMLVFLSK